MVADLSAAVGEIGWGWLTFRARSATVPLMKLAGKSILAGMAGGFVGNGVLGAVFG